MFKNNRLFTPQHLYTYIYSSYCFPYIYYGTDQENLCGNQGGLLLVIKSFVLITLMCDLAVILQVEMRCQSLLGVRGFILTVPPITSLGHDILPKNYRKQQFHYFLKLLSSVGTSVNNSHDDDDVQCQIWPVWTGPHKLSQHTLWM